METVQALFNITLVVMIVSTMFLAGLTTTIAQFGGVFRNWVLVLLVLLVNLVLLPLIGWGTAALLALATPAYIALLLIASSPGAPFGAKLVMMSRGDVVTGATLQVLLAAIGSATFPITANVLIKAANLDGGISLPVGDLVKTIAFLQLIPFAVGLALRHWSPETAMDWQPVTAKVSNHTFVAVLAGALLGSWKQIVDLVGSKALLAMLIFVAAALVLGALLAVGSTATQTSVALLAPGRNIGPVFAAIGIAFKNDPAILGTVAGMAAIGLVIAVPIAAYLAKNRPAPGEAKTTAEPGEIAFVSPNGKTKVIAGTPLTKLD